MLFDDHQVLHHVEGVSIRLHWNQALLFAVHLEEAIVVQAHHFSLWSILTPEMHTSPTEARAETHCVIDLIISLDNPPPPQLLSSAHNPHKSDIRYTVLTSFIPCTLQMQIFLYIVRTINSTNLLTARMYAMST